MPNFLEGSFVNVKRDTQKVKAGTTGRITALMPNALDNEGYICILWHEATPEATSEWFTRPVADAAIEVLET